MNFASSKIIVFCLFEFEGENYPSVKSILNQFNKTADSARIENSIFKIHTDIESNYSKNEYLESVRKIRDHICAGDVYQVNMSQRFESVFSGSSFALYKELYQANPASFFSFINAGTHTIVSTSPERFIKQNGLKIEAKPIKGTRPRGKTEDKDKKLRSDLLNSKKDVRQRCIQTGSACPDDNVSQA